MRGLMLVAMHYCTWPSICARAADYVIVGGCLEHLHIQDGYFCEGHAREMAGMHRQGRVYCQTCHGDNPPWGHLVPLAELSMERL